MSPVVGNARSPGATALAFYALSLLSVAAASQARAVEAYEGLAYASGTKTLLYPESHWIDGTQRVVLYRCPGGEPFARKRVDSEASATAPDFELVDARDGYREGVRNIDGTREAFVQDNVEAPVRRKAVVANQPVIDAGFDAFVCNSWKQLEILRAPFVIPGRLGTLDFSVRNIGDTAGGRRIRLSLAGWYGGALPHIDLLHAASDPTLLHYKGMSNIRGNDGKHHTAEIQFPAARRRQDVARSEADAALAATLTRSCGS